MLTLVMFRAARSGRWRFLALFLLGLGVVAAHSAVQAREPQKWALLVGVDEYATLRKLRYAGDDQRALAAQLIRSGFPDDQVFLLHDKASEKKYLPFRENILRELEQLLRLARRDDTLIVAFSGHGVHLDGHDYLCPASARYEDPADSMLQLDGAGGLFERLQKCQATLKLVLVDACRNDPRIDRDRSVGPGPDVLDFTGSLKQRPPAGMLLIQSCGERQKAQEDEDLGHGVFMHFLLEGLRGQAANREGIVTLSGLYDYASFKTEKYVSKKFGGYQSPGMEGKIDGSFEICRVDRQPVALPERAPVVPERPAVPPARAAPGETISNTIGMKLTLIPAGEFMMGSPTGEAGRGNDETQHRVRITRPFYLGTYEVTLGQFLKFYHEADYKDRWDTNGQAFGWGLVPKNGKMSFELDKRFVPWSWGHTAQTKEHPVVNVSWNDANTFCEWLSRKEGQRYRLPTEAEWEYACRAGATSRFSHGDEEEGLVGVGNVADASFRESYDASYGIQGRDGYPFTAPVGQFAPNGFGLYDMHGNAWELCSDWYDKDYYARSPVDDPQGPSAGSSRVIRGGGWLNYPVFCRSAYRSGYEPANRDFNFGFRVVCER